MITKDLGAVSAYAYAVEKGYTGTEAEYAELMASYATVAQQAGESAQTASEKAQQASASATSASQSASSASASAQTAQTAQQTATTKASEASQSASTATTKASKASQSASTASAAATSASTSAQTATTAASTATTKASKAAASEAAALSAKTDAESARDAAAQSASQAAESARTLTIDATLTQAGQAADAKETGDKISELKSNLNQTFVLNNSKATKIPENSNLNEYVTSGIYLSERTSVTNTLSNIPDTNIGAFRLIVSEYLSSNRVYQEIISYSKGMYYRFMLDGSWSAWEQMASKEYINDTHPLFLSNTNAKQLPDNTDLNSCTTPDSYYALTEASAITIVNKPVGLTKPFRLIVMKYGKLSARIMQIIISMYNAIYFRTSTETVWSDWEQMASKEHVDATDKGNIIIGKGASYSIRLNDRLNKLKGDYALNPIDHWYGVEWVEGEAGVSRINSAGDDNLHTTLPIQSEMKRCVVKDSSVLYYLNPDDSSQKQDGTPAILTGEDGNVCVKIPEFFFRFEEEDVNSKRHIKLKLSKTYLPGFTYSPPMFVGAYEATIDHVNNKLVSVCTTSFNYSDGDILTHSSTNYITDDAESIVSHGTHVIAEINAFSEEATRYRGGNNNSSYDGLTPASNEYWRNNLGRPIARIGEKEFNQLSDILNNEFIYLYDAHKALWMLSMVEFPIKDIQSDTNGLGLGASVWPSYDAFKQWCINDTESIIPCGVTNKLGNNSGTVYIKVTNVPISVSGTYPNADPSTYVRGNVWVPCVSYRGIEHYYGHLYKTLRQIKIKMVRTGEIDQSLNKEKRLVKYFYSSNPFLSNDDELHLIAKRTFAPETVNTFSYIFGPEGHILPQQSTNIAYKNEQAYSDCTEFNHYSIYKDEMYPITTNGSLINENYCGRNMLVAAPSNGLDANPRVSNGTRITCVDVCDD